jgi:hypothetical protein
VIVYTDGTESRQKIRRRHHVGMFFRRWGENCFEAVAHSKPYPMRSLNEQPGNVNWGRAETRVTAADAGPWVNWLWAWENPHPDKEIVALRFEPKAGTIIVSAISAGTASSQPLRWQTRRKAVLRLPEGVEFDYKTDARGLLKEIQLDMGQVISAEPLKIYPNADWSSTYNNMVPEISQREVQIEYAAHPDARFHLEGGRTVRVSELVEGKAAGPLVPIRPATVQTTIRVIDKATKKPVPVKLHVHGESGEYLAPVDRHRLPNRNWFEDYSPEFQHQGRHYCVYMPGETVIDLPLGNVYVEVSKGF